MERQQRGHLGSKNPLMRLNALKELVSQRQPQLQEILLAYSKDEASVVRAYAATQLVALFDDQYVSALIPLLKDEGIVRQQVINALRSTHENIAPVILDHIESDNALIRAGCASVLGTCPSAEAVHVLIGLLHDEDIRPRVNAARSLGEIGAKAAIPALVGAIDDRSDLVGRAAIMALGDLKDPSVLDMLVKRLNSEENRLIKQSLIYALGELRSPQAAQPLLDVFLETGESEKMRDSAALALTLLGDEGKRALQTALVEGDEFAQQFAKAYLHLKT